MNIVIFQRSVFEILREKHIFPQSTGNVMGVPEMSKEYTLICFLNEPKAIRIDQVIVVSIFAFFHF